MMNALESHRLRLRDSNIAHRCKISYNPVLGVVYFYYIRSKISNYNSIDIARSIPLLLKHDS